MTTEQLNNWHPSQRQLERRSLKLNRLSQMRCQVCIDLYLERIRRGLEQMPPPPRLEPDVVENCFENVIATCIECGINVHTLIYF
jgi:hypothetical protein